METYFKSLGADVWFSVASGYNALKKPKIAAQKEAKRNNKLGIYIILDGFTVLVNPRWDYVHHQNSFGTSYKTFM